MSVITFPCRKFKTDQAIGQLVKTRDLTFKIATAPAKRDWRVPGPPSRELLELVRRGSVIDHHHLDKKLVDFEKARNRAVDALRKARGW